MAKFNTILARNIKGVANNLYGFTHTVAFSHYNNISAQLPVDENGKIIGKNIEEQAIQCFKNLDKIVKGIKHSLNDVVRLTIFTKNEKHLLTVVDVMNTFFKKYKPAVTLLVVKNIPLNALVQVEAVITCGEGTIPNAPQAGDLIKIARNTKFAPTNIFSSQTVAFSHYNHLSAQLPLNPQTNKIVGKDVKEQLKQCLNNVKTILQSIDVPFDDIVKVNIYTTINNEEKNIKEIYKTFFPDAAIARSYNYLPALSIIKVVQLPLNAKVQVEVTVSHGDGTPPQLVEDRHGIVIEFKNTNVAPINPSSSQTVAFSHYNNISEILPINIRTNKPNSSNINEQLNYCLQHLKKIVESVNHKITDVVKINFFVSKISMADGFNQILRKYFTKLPAGRVIEVDLPKGINVKIDAIVSNAEGTPPVIKK